MPPLSHDSPAVHSYLGILQDVIGRMANNSAGAKTWCVALLSAILVIVVDKQAPYLAWIALTPVLLFGFLDAYYLALERRFRTTYNEFIRKLHDGEASIDDLFVVSPSSGSHVDVGEIVEALQSVSVWPFYCVQLGLLMVIGLWLAS